MKWLRIAALLLLQTGLVRAALDGPLTPDQAVASFRLDSGLKIECVASEPMVASPVAVAWDERGRMYVVEDRGYPVGPGPGRPPAGQIVLLEDTKGSGHYDKRTVFASGLTFPNGVMCWKGGIFVTCAPYLYYFKDTDGDGVADVKQIVFKGFQDLSTTQLRVSHPVLNIDNWIYLTSGLTSAKVSSPLYPDHAVVNCNRSDFRFRPDTDQFEATAGAAQFGQTFDDYGRKFICSNRNHNQQVMMQLNYLERNHDFAFSDIVQDTPDHGAAGRVYPLSANITTAAAHAGYFTSACGLLFYRGNALPNEYRNNSFTCEPAGNLVHRDVLEQTNSTFVAHRAADGVEFLASPDNWFRPVNLATGPDGALYVCDMYRKTIEHPDYLPEAVRKATDFESGKDKGRIYRISAVNTPPNAGKFDLAKANVDQLCDTLNHPDVWWRTTAQRMLLERQDKAIAGRLRSICLTARAPETRVLALRLLDGLGVLTDDDILIALNDREAAIRENGIQAAEPRLGKSRALAKRVLALATDRDARVRFQCALSLGALEGSRAIPALTKIAIRDTEDRWTRAAVLTSIDHHGADLLDSLLSTRNKNVSGMSALLVELSRVLGASEPPAKLPALLAQVTASATATNIAWQQAAVTGFADGVRGRGLVPGGENALRFLTSGDTASAHQARKRVNELIKDAIQTATDASQPLQLRLVALGLLAQTEFSVSGDTLQILIDPQQPGEIQVAAVRALGQMPDAAVGPALVRKDRWGSYTPPVREAVLDVLFAQPRHVKTLFAAIEAGDVPAWTVNGDRRAQLLKSKDESIRRRAAALFKEMQAGDRMKVYEEYKSILTLPPNPKQGHAVFTRTCAGCHVVSGEGNAVGPDLTGIRNQPQDVLLLHIIVPEYEIAPNYTCYNVETKDGRTLTGLLAAETPSNITLRQALGHEEVIARSNIASMNTSILSLMPEDLEKTMTRQELMDLIGFLKGM